jgi:hypothetical protein
LAYLLVRRKPRPRKYNYDVSLDAVEMPRSRLAPLLQAGHGAALSRAELG